MGFEESSRFCRFCDQRVLVRRQTPMRLIHFLMSLLTAGLWLAVWFLAECFKKPWRCSRCGKKV